MANLNPHYDFDRFAEYLCVTIADNVARCQLSQNKVQKVRIYTSNDALWPTAFKVLLENELVAPLHSHTISNADASYDISYRYRCPSAIPFKAAQASSITSPFIEQAKKMDTDFYTDAWSLSLPGCIPYLLKQVAYRNVSLNLAKQLQAQGIAISEEFSVQFHDGENFISFNYDNLTQQISQQIQFYLNDEKVKQIACDVCFKHPQNKQWFMSL